MSLDIAKYPQWVKNHCYIQYQDQETDVDPVLSIGLHTLYFASFYMPSCVCARAQFSANLLHVQVRGTTNHHQDPGVWNPFPRVSVLSITQLLKSSL